VLDARDIQHQLSKAQTLGPGANGVEGRCKICGDNHAQECENLVVMSMKQIRRSDSCSVFVEHIADNATAGIFTTVGFEVGRQCDKP
jgi:hypothetical protein